MQLERGDIIFAVRWCGTFFHYGIYVGNSEVIHYNTQDKDDYTWAHNSIIKTSFDDFANGDPVYIEPRDSNTSNEATARKAEELLVTGRNEYNLVNNNCEHFCYLCRNGSKSSQQVWDAGWKLTFRALQKIAYPAATKIINTGLDSFKKEPLLNLSLKILATAVKVIISSYQEHLKNNIIHRFNLTRIDNVRNSNASFGYGLDNILDRCPHCGAPMPKKEHPKCFFCNTFFNKKYECDCCGAPYYIKTMTKCDYCGSNPQILKQNTYFQQFNNFNYFKL